MKSYAGGSYYGPPKPRPAAYSSMESAIPLPRVEITRSALGWQGFWIVRPHVDATRCAIVFLGYVAWVVAIWTFASNV